MSNFIYYEKLEDYEEQVRKAKECDKKEKEIERLNNIIEKKEQVLGDNIKRLEREVVKRDNIINELENYIRARADDNNICSVCSVMTDDLLNILKGVDKN